MTEENNDNELRDNFKKKLYFKKYYQEHKNDYKVKNDSQDTKDKKKEYYELNKENKKQYQKDRYYNKIKNVEKKISPDDVIINNLYKEYLEQKLKLKTIE